MSKTRCVAAGAALVLSASMVPSLARAGQLDSRLTGAWATSAAECKEAFVVSNGRFSLRQPVNGLSVAFIVEPRRIVATTGQCRVNNVATKGAHFVASLSCNNSIGYLPIAARFKILDANQITYGSGADPLMDSTYQRCR